ncbi:hypothetical protein [Paracoccus sp. (in: a-proteobacteria)]|uniref:hypothetical protein n=1 Tax=Paracoccus sp. TaxID=267 RepID=UPI0028A0ED81|nr:hypothetical protein [Paracoccus sp. (in: a-proteobacteria)]
MANDYSAKLEAERTAAREKYAADMEGQPPLKRREELWWVGRDEESFGACAPARDEAIQIGRRDYDDGAGFYIIQARQDEIDLAAAFNMERFDEAVEEHFEDLAGEDHDGFLTNYSGLELAALETAMRQTIRQWQVKTRLAGGGTCLPQIFTECGKAERIPSDKEGGVA